MTDAELERLATGPGGPEFSEADLAVPRRKVLGHIRRQRWMWRAAVCAAAVVLLVLSVPEPKVETLALSVPPIAAPEVHVAPPVTRVIRTVHRHQPPRQEAEQKPVVVKMLTDDPNIVIYLVSD